MQSYCSSKSVKPLRRLFLRLGRQPKNDINCSDIALKVSCVKQYRPLVVRFRFLNRRSSFHYNWKAQLVDEDSLYSFPHCGLRNAVAELFVEGFDRQEGRGLFEKRLFQILLTFGNFEWRASSLDEDFGVTCRAGRFWACDLKVLFWSRRHSMWSCYQYWSRSKSLA